MVWLAVGVARAPRAALFAAIGVVASGQDIGTIGVSQDFPGSPDAGPYFRLRGQSFFFQARTNSGTSGGQLDGVTSFDSQTAVHEISFGEAFPGPLLQDYLRFGYFGVVERVEQDHHGDDVIVDQSFVLAARGAVDGMTFESLFTGMDEATLVTALTTQFDSPEFFQATDVVTNSAAMQGDIRLIDWVTEIRPGERLSLYGFFDDGTGAQVARSIGFMDFTMRRIPGPSVLGLAGAAMVMGIRRRR